MLLVERWDDAFEVFRWVFEQLIRAQPENGRFHKGSPLHNMAVARLQGGHPAEGLRWTLLAFIEDALSRAEESPSHWDELQRPAANLLRLLGFGERELYGLAERVRARVTEGELVSDPTRVFVDENLDRQVRLLADGAGGGVVRAEPEIRVFVSSPGDLRGERRLVAEVCRELSSTLGLRLRALLWEGGGPRNPEVQPFPPDVTGQATQAVLDKYVWDALGGYDVYVGMIWKRMGTPTGGWRSGTEAEFRYALRTRQETERPSRIAFYCKLPRPSERADPEVGRFVEELRGMGLVQSFATRGDLRRMLVDHLSSDARQAITGQPRLKDSSAAVTAHLRQLLAGSVPSQGMQARRVALDPRLGILRELRNLNRERARTSTIVELDLEGLADHLSLSAEVVQDALIDLLAEGSAEPYKATLARLAENGRCRITQAGMRELARLEAG